MAQIRNRGANIWQIGIFQGRENGKKIMYYETFYGSKTQAKLYGNDLEKAMKKKVGSSKAPITSVSELLDNWLEDIKKRVEKSTYDQYQRQATKLNSILGDLQLYTLDSIGIAERLEVLDNEERMSARTIKNHYNTLTSAMHWGAVKKYVAKGVMDGIKPPMLEHKSRDVFKPDELNSFIETARGFKHYLPLKILALTGMRVGEILGLKWKNVSDDGIIKIVEAVNSRLRYLKSTKTLNSKRELRLDEETINELLEHKRLMSMNDKAKDNDYVFQSDDGECLRYQVLLKAKNRVLKKAGLHHIRIHDLRHGVGSIMLDSGESITSVAEQLGQVPATTAGTYSHALKKGGSISKLLK